jgi:hypothetical protein
MNADLTNSGGEGPALSNLVYGWAQDYLTNGYATNTANPTRPYKASDFHAVNVGLLHRQPCLFVCSKLRVEQPAAYHFGWSLHQRLWLMRCDGAWNSSLVLDIPSSLTLGTPTLASQENDREVIFLAVKQRSIVPAASHPTVTSRASAGRLLRTKPQVYLYVRYLLSSLNNHRNPFRSCRSSPPLKCIATGFFFHQNSQE